MFIIETARRVTVCFLNLFVSPYSLTRFSSILVFETNAKPFSGKLMKRTTLIVLFIELLSISIFVLYPSPIESVAWSPSRSPALNGVLEQNTALQKTELFGVGIVDGPEDIAVDKSGRIYSGNETGDIIRVLSDGTIQRWVNTGGRPLGMMFDAKQNLVVCDADLGLLSINPQGVIKILTNSVDGLAINFPKSVDIASNGKIYFTDASTKWKKKDYLYDLLEAIPYGRLLEFDPATKQTKVLMTDLYFANGVALSSDERFVLVTETWRYRVKRYWLKGNKAGESAQFLGNLPGFPSGISNNDSGRFWLSLVSVRNPVLDQTHKTPGLKNGLAKLPEFLTPGPIPYGLVLGISDRGPLEMSLHDPKGETIQGISSAEERDGFLYFGTFKGDRIGRLKL